MLRKCTMSQTVVGVSGCRIVIFLFSAVPAAAILYLMNTTSFHRWLAGSLFLLALSNLGCDGEAPSRGDNAPPRDKEATKPAAEVTRRPFGKYKNIYLERQGDQLRVVVAAQVCLREGQLEELLCRKGTKEHEAVLSADVDARAIHLALIAAGAKEGSPVKFEPEYAAASGSAIKINLEYEKDGKKVVVPAQDWIRNPKTKKNLDHDWVFGGSKLVANPDGKDKPPIYLANYGDIVCVCNMESALLDLPVMSPKRFEDRMYEAHTERIPAQETKVMVIFEPAKEKKEK